MCVERRKHGSDGAEGQQCPLATSPLRDELEDHLSPLKRVNAITGWFDREIRAGAEWALEIETQLHTSHIVLLLLSPDFIASNNCYSLMQKAFESEKIHAIPILLRPLIWETLPINGFQPLLPHDGRAVTTWSNQDEAFRDVAWGICEVVKTLLPKHLLTLQETSVLYPEVDQPLSLEENPHATEPT